MGTERERCGGVRTRVSWLGKKQGVMFMVSYGYGMIMVMVRVMVMAKGEGQWYKQNSIDRTEQRAETASECMQVYADARGQRGLENKHILERSYHCCSISIRTP